MNTREKIEKQFDICVSNINEYQTSDHEVLEKELNEAGKWADRLIEYDKLNQEKELEEKKQKESGLLKKIELGLLGLGTVVVPVILAVMNRNTLYHQTRDVCEFEKTNSFTTQAGKGISSCFKMDLKSHK